MAKATINLAVPENFSDQVAGQIRRATAAELRRMANTLDPEGDPVASTLAWLDSQIKYEAKQMEKHGPPPPDGEGEWSFHYGMSDAYHLARRRLEPDYD